MSEKFTGKVQVDFNNLRVNACRSMSKLIDFLNYRLEGGVIESFDAEDIKDLIDGLSSDIQFIACVNNGSDDFADVSGTVEMSEFCYGDENE